MRHAYSLAHLTALGLTPPELIEAAVGAGYTYIGLRLNRTTPEEALYDLVNDRPLMLETKRQLAATGMKVWDIEVARMDAERDHNFYRPLLDASAELGARQVIAQVPDADRNRATDHFGSLCDLAQTLGLGVSLEFVSWTETLDLAEAVRILRAVNRPNANILVDMLHFHRSGSSREMLKTLPREWFKWAHICDAPARIPTERASLIYTARQERLFPGDGGIDIKGILRCMPQDIVYSLEIPGEPTAAKVGFNEYVNRAIRASERYLDREPA